MWKYNAPIKESEKKERYNNSMMGANLLKKGEDFDKLPETRVIFITENDVMGKGLQFYPIERCFLENGKRFKSVSHILYINGAYHSNTSIGKLMHYFSYTDAADMYYVTLANRVRFFKGSKEEIVIFVPAYGEYEESGIKRRNQRSWASYIGIWEMLLGGNC